MPSPTDTTEKPFPKTSPLNVYAGFFKLKALRVPIKPQSLNVECEDCANGNKCYRLVKVTVGGTPKLFIVRVPVTTKKF